MKNAVDKCTQYNRFKSRLYTIEKLFENPSPNPDLSTSVSYNTVGNGLCAVPGTIPFYTGETIGCIGIFTVCFF